MGVGREYPPLLGFRSDDKLPLWLEEPLLFGEENDQLPCSEYGYWEEETIMSRLEFEYEDMELNPADEEWSSVAGVIGCRV